jgi:hypothetical protein
MTIAPLHCLVWCDTGFGTLAIVNEDKIITEAMVFGKG